MHDSSPWPVLSPSQLQDFYETGYVLVPDVFQPREVALMAEATDRLRAMADSLPSTGQVMHQGSQFVLGRTPQGQVRIDRVVWCGAAEPMLLDYGADPRLLRLAAQVLGGPVLQQLINQVHFKLPGDGVEFPWHQDSLHRRYGTPEWQDVNGRGSYVQAVVAIDDCTLDNGPLLFVDRSCRHGHIPVEGPEHLLPPHFIEPEQIRAVAMRAGSLVLFGPYTIHGSTMNRSNGPRRLFINGYCSQGANTRTYPGEGSGRMLTVP
jgi:ectoine hydroxylase-related dioxygenase (phytanoyl-CoA dioxygenase family)